MPRRLRIHVPGGVYHVTLRGNHRQPIFHAAHDRTLFNTIVARALEKFEARLHAYCWMTNHAHMVVQVGSEPLAGPMHDIAAEYARAVQKKMDTSGHFFERRYHASLVDADSYMLELLRYVHRNPVTAGIVARVDDHRWSSHQNYRGARDEPWVTTDFALGMFGQDRAKAVAAYLRFVDADQNLPWEPSRVTAKGAAVIGSDDFVARTIGKNVRVRNRESLEGLLREACRRFEVERGMLASPMRDGYMTRVRAWIAHQATRRGIATLAAVARELGRTEGALRYALHAYPDEIE